uniref:Protein kinase domain-containing protein n=1 Tax=Panagrolaimus sp. PS1159 TaxID=55785 RepID=A0AC35FSC4_9BILA
MSGGDLIKFKPGKIVCGKWKILEMLGAGGCGAVFEATCLTRKNFTAALKVEANNIEDGGVLKLEAEVLEKLKNKHNVIRLIDSGKRQKYSFIVMTLCGPDLMFLRLHQGTNNLKREHGRFSEATIMRIGVHSLFAIKQLHEIGYTHRDVKPGNMVVGLHGRDSRVIFLIDYGMVRSFILKDAKNSSSIRKPRRNALFRGTFRYCSINAHNRLEQGRVDDLWSLLYMLAECYIGLPWSKYTDEQQLLKLKGSFTDDEYSKRLPAEFRLITQHLKTLQYDTRPNYKEIYDALMKGVKRLKTDFSSAYDWEDEKDLLEPITTALSFSDPKMSKKPLTKEQLEWKLYPSTDPMRFEENILGF